MVCAPKEGSGRVRVVPGYVLSFTGCDVSFCGTRSSRCSFARSRRPRRSAPGLCSVQQPPGGSESGEAGGRTRLREVRRTGPSDERPFEGGPTGTTDLFCGAVAGGAVCNLHLCQIPPLTRRFLAVREANAPDSTAVLRLSGENRGCNIQKRERSVEVGRNQGYVKKDIFYPARYPHTVSFQYLYGSVEFPDLTSMGGNDE
jgi:hypothetical protein